MNRFAAVYRREGRLIVVGSDTVIDSQSGTANGWSRVLDDAATTDEQLGQVVEQAHADARDVATDHRQPPEGVEAAALGLPDARTFERSAVRVSADRFGDVLVVGSMKRRARGGYLATTADAEEELPVSASAGEVGAAVRRMLAASS